MYCITEEKLVFSIGYERFKNYFLYRKSKGTSSLRLKNSYIHLFFLIFEINILSFKADN